MTDLQPGDLVWWDHKCRIGFGVVKAVERGNPNGATFLDRADFAVVDRMPWSGDCWGDWRDHDRSMFADSLGRWRYDGGAIVREAIALGA